ncbi:thioredoxin-dependent thiol peroxidase [Capnocytophaga sp.]|uniref:thioredoxin-dependent thiol peroxidase n=1 Tax=Capnocytophaga sp. TaxID=44737 RepID=UPI0026DA9893|nr:thioredoxin-dependent thiol peroxidase [Capnocytophaga sp.]MDO5105817.1 thioredoxin-dependent thiol peroxidase [Capnocytophaga sp.]
MLKIGDQVTDFSSTDQNGKTLKLSDFQGKKLIIFFYPKASTPGCTTQACNLRDGYQLLKEKGYEIMGISADSVSKQTNFTTKNNLPFVLLADENKEIIKLFGVWGEKKFMGKIFDGIHRTTFILDENHVITHVIHKVKTKEHTRQILEIIDN